MAKERMKLKEELIRRACSIAMKAHKSSCNNPYILCEISSSQVMFGFSGSWEVGEWFSHMPFGDSKINLNLFPSLKTIGSNEPSKVNQAFLHRFETILANTSLENEVQRAATEREIIFTGHSTSGAIAIFATLWFLESQKQKHINQTTPPLCITFGSPLVGDKTLTHAINREHWAQYFTHFIMRYDIVPRIFLSPLSSIHRELQTIVQYFNPNSPFYASDSILRASEASSFVMAVIKNASLVTGYLACKFMGSTNLIIENVTNFVEISPYRPLGTYVFCAGNGKFISLENSDAIQQILFYCLQIGSEFELNAVLQRSLKEHLMYERELVESFEIPREVYLDHLHHLPLSIDNYRNVEHLTICNALNDLGLSTRARLCLRATGELEKQKERNQSRINSNKKQIDEFLSKIERYKVNCEVQKVGYYDAFKIQKHTDDFNNNIRRLELAGIWDEIIEMLKRNELPDDFEGQRDWVEIGTRYRRIVEPLDIANYYRHLKNEDTGSYLGNGRPSRYRYTQKWREHAEKMGVEPVPESCFWAEVEELEIMTRKMEFSERVKERVLCFERNVSLWARHGLIGKDVLLDESTFVKWWKRLPIEHRSVSCIRDLFHECV